MKRNPNPPLAPLSVSYSERTGIITFWQFRHRQP